MSPESHRRDRISTGSRHASRSCRSTASSETADVVEIRSRRCDSGDMTNLLKRLALAAGANGLLLLLAAVLFDKFELSFVGWLIAAVLFTVLTLLLGGVMDALAGK